MDLALIVWVVREHEIYSLDDDHNHARLFFNLDIEWSFTMTRTRCWILERVYTSNCAGHIIASGWVKAGDGEASSTAMFYASTCYRDKPAATRSRLAFDGCWTDRYPPQLILVYVSSDIWLRSTRWLYEWMGCTFNVQCLCLYVLMGKVSLHLVSMHASRNPSRYSWLAFSISSAVCFVMQ